MTYEEHLKFNKEANILQNVNWAIGVINKALDLDVILFSYQNILVPTGGLF